MKKKQKFNKTEILITSAVIGVVMCLMFSTSIVRAGSTLWDRIADTAGRILGNRLADEVGEIDVTLGAFPGPDMYQNINFLNGVMYSYHNATKTVATSVILEQKDMMVNGSYYDTIGMSPLVAATTFTWFASSTVPSYLPRTGDRHEFCWTNSTTTTAALTTFAAGTGINLKTASSTPAGYSDLTLKAGDTACFHVIRASSTATTFDLDVLMTEYMDAD